MNKLEEVLNLKEKENRISFYDSVLFCFDEFPSNYSEYLERSIKYAREFEFDGIPILSPEDNKSLIKRNVKGSEPDYFLLEKTIKGLEKIGSREVSIGFTLTGLMTSLYKMDSDILEKIMTKPEYVQSLLANYSLNLRKVLDNIQEFVDFFIIVDPISSNSIISPLQFKEFCSPYYRSLSSVSSKPFILHSPGKILPNMPEISNASFLGIQPIDNDDFSTVVEKSLNRACVIGNIHKSVIFNGSKEEIKEEVDRCVTIFRNKEHPAILHSDFWIRRDTPKSQVKLLIEVIKSK